MLTKKCPSCRGEGGFYPAEICDPVNQRPCAECEGKGTVRSRVISIDFDGTIVQHKFPHIGELMPLAEEVIKQLMEAGDRLVLWTCRTVHHLQEAVEFCEKAGFRFRSINDTHPEDRFGVYVPGPKVLADVYIDDRNLLGFPGWDVVRHVLLVAWGVHNGKARKPCRERPELLEGQPIGMYHCPECGEMQAAGVNHLPPPQDYEEQYRRLWPAGYHE